MVHRPRRQKSPQVPNSRSAHWRRQDHYIGILQIEDTLRDPFTHVNASNVSDPYGCFADDTDSIMTFTVHDDHLMVLGALPAVALVAL